MSESAFDLRVDATEGSYQLVARGELDLGTVSALRVELDRAAQSRARRVVIDLRELTFIDSTGIHCLAEASRRFTGDQPLVIIPARRSVHRVFELAGLAHRLPFCSASRLLESAAPSG
jgi:anti-sigma B factor antagonist